MEEGSRISVEVEIPETRTEIEEEEVEDEEEEEGRRELASLVLWKAKKKVKHGNRGG